MISIRRLLAPLVALAPLASPGTAQIDYELEIDHDARVWKVTGRIANPGAEDFEFWIPRWTAGAYHIADYGRFASDLSATGTDGTPLAVERIDDSHWRIGAAGSEEVTVDYRAASISEATFANNVIDVESNRIAQDYAYVTPVSLFGFVPERIDEAITLAVTLPDGWRTATILGQDEAGLFHAPSYYRFEDSPLFFSASHRTIELEAGGKPLRVTVYGRDDETAQAVAADCRAIVDAAAQLMGGLPYPEYEFLIAFVPESQGGSGLEHSYSTLILLGEQMPLEGAWSIIAHEFFHLWCAERIHVEAIHRPDYTQPLETGTIWVNEGFTEYFTQHILFHAGLIDQQTLIENIATDAPHLPPQLMPEGTTWTDVSRAAHEWSSMQDLMIFAVRMYMQGPRTVFALDMEMRRASEGERGIHDLLIHLNEEYVEEDRGFPEDGMIEIINEVAQGDLREFYESYIDGPEFPDTAHFLDVIGYQKDGNRIMRLEDASQAQLRARADFLSIDGIPKPTAE